MKNKTLRLGKRELKKKEQNKYYNESTSPTEKERLRCKIIVRDKIS